MRVLKSTQLKIAVKPADLDYKTLTQVTSFTRSTHLSWPMLQELVYVHIEYMLVTEFRSVTTNDISRWVNKYYVTYDKLRNVRKKYYMIVSKNNL